MLIEILAMAYLHVLEGTLTIIDTLCEGAANACKRIFGGLQKR